MWVLVVHPSFLAPRHPPSSVHHHLRNPRRQPLGLAVRVRSSFIRTFVPQTRLTTSPPSSRIRRSTSLAPSPAKSYRARESALFLLPLLSAPPSTPPPPSCLLDASTSQAPIPIMSLPTAKVGGSPFPATPASHGPSSGPFPLVPPLEPPRPIRLVPSPSLSVPHPRRQTNPSFPTPALHDRRCTGPRSTRSQRYVSIEAGMVVSFLLSFPHR